jgi:hypothetical protein
MCIGIKESVYKTKFMDCPVKCIGQRGRTFQTRYKEHTQAIRYINSNSGYSNYIFNTEHAYGNITITAKVVKTGEKGKYLNTLKTHIQGVPGGMYQTSGGCSLC